MLNMRPIADLFTLSISDIFVYSFMLSINLSLICMSISLFLICHCHCSYPVVDLPLLRVAVEGSNVHILISFLRLDDFCLLEKIATFKK